jgi:hypothetical protein
MGAIRSGEAPTDAETFVLLLEEAIKRSVAARAFSFSPTTKDLEETLGSLEGDREKRDTLEKILELFGGDRRAFLEEVVASSLVESELWKRFGQNAAVQQGSRTSAEQILSKAQENPKTFLSQGSPDGTFSRALIPLSTEADDRIPKGNPLPRLDAGVMDRDLLARTDPGRFYPVIVDSPDAFRVLRVSRQASGYVEVETWAVPKVRYLDWMISQGQDLGKSIDSPELRSAVDALDPNHWVRRVFHP